MVASISIKDGLCAMNGQMITLLMPSVCMQIAEILRMRSILMRVYVFSAIAHIEMDGEIVIVVIKFKSGSDKESVARAMEGNCIYCIDPIIPGPGCEIAKPHYKYYGTNEIDWKYH